MICPKCSAQMEAVTYGAQHITVDRCTQCQGLWFDQGEAEHMRGEWMSELVDNGDVALGKINNTITDCGCPRCGKKMQHVHDAKQPQIGYETCAEHGMYFDAGEFTDYKYETLLEKIIRSFRRS